MTYLNEVLSPSPEPMPSKYEPGERTRMSVKAAKSISLTEFIGEGHFRTVDPTKSVRSREQSSGIAASNTQYRTSDKCFTAMPPDGPQCPTIRLRHMTSIRMSRGVTSTFYVTRSIDTRN